MLNRTIFSYLSFLFLLIASTSVFAQSSKLNQVLGEFSDVSDAKVSPDGQYVVFMANPNPQHVELFSVPIGGGPVVRLNSDLAVSSLGGGNFFYGDVHNFKISPDGQHVIYTAFQRTTFDRELFSVPITGGAQTLLNRGDFHPMRPGPSFVFDFEFTPDSQRIVFAHDFQAYERNELYSVSVSGADRKRLSPDLVGSNVKSSVSFEIAPNGQRVFFTINKAGNDNYELYSSPISSRAPTRLATPAQDSIFGIQDTTPDGQRVIFTAADGSGVYKLYSVPHNGAAASLLSGSIVANSRSGFLARVTPNGQRVIFGAPDVPETHFWNTLLSASISGGAPIRLSSNNANTYGMYTFEISPNGQHVVFNDNDQKNVFRVSPTGGALTKLSPNLSNFSSSNRFRDIEISKDSSRAVFRLVRFSSNGAKEAIYSSPTGGGSVVRLNPVLPNNAKMNLFSITPDSSTVIYTADQNSVGKNELYAVPIAGGLAVTLNATLVSGGNVAQVGNNSHRRPFFLSDGSSDIIVYIADQNIDEKYELFGVSLDTNQRPAVTITTPKNGVRVDTGSRLNFSASALDFEDGNISASIAWKSSIDGNLGTGATLSSVLLSEGTHLITARASDSKGKQGSASVTVRIGENTIITPILLLLLLED